MDWKIAWKVYFFYDFVVKRFNVGLHFLHSETVKCLHVMQAWSLWLVAPTSSWTEVEVRGCPSGGSICVGPLALVRKVKILPITETLNLGVRYFSHFSAGGDRKGLFELCKEIIITKFL